MRIITKDKDYAGCDETIAGALKQGKMIKCKGASFTDVWIEGEVWIKDYDNTYFQPYITLQNTHCQQAKPYTCPEKRMKSRYDTAQSLLSMGYEPDNVGDWDKCGDWLFFSGWFNFCGESEDWIRTSNPTIIERFPELFEELK